MMTAAEASPLYLQPAGAAAEGVYVQATLGVVGQAVPSANKYQKLIDAFAGPFQGLVPAAQARLGARRVVSVVEASTVQA
jgi:hypothetical protein